MDNSWIVASVDAVMVGAEETTQNRFQLILCRSDISITRRLKEAGEIMRDKLLDHVIVGDGTYLSFTERGLLYGRRAALDIQERFLYRRVAIVKKGYTGGYANHNNKKAPAA